MADLPNCIRLNEKTSVVMNNPEKRDRLAERFRD